MGWLGSMDSLSRVKVFGALMIFSLPGCELQAAEQLSIPVFSAEITRKFSAFDANQGVAVDVDHFFAINNYRITKHDKETGEPLLQWDGAASRENALIHLDSGFVLDDRLYAAHSNYPRSPMTSSIEIWDTVTLEHTGTHSFGVELGSMTWLDRYAGFWWAAFANYDRVQAGQDQPYGETKNTQIVKLNDDFTVLERWTLPEGVLQRMAPMSNSGGSWGRDGYLYLTGHNYPEVYVMAIPASGAELDWVATVEVPGLNGQGIAWDRSTQESVLWAILRQGRLVLQIAMPVIELEQSETKYLRGPGEFNTD